ncbi:hypothetical protein [Sulfurovum sp.]|nr:hypothetical protein [Sulfurovum sp.]
MKTVPIMAELTIVKDTGSNLIWEEKVTHTEAKVCCKALRLVRCVSDIK